MAFILKSIREILWNHNIEALNYTISLPDDSTFFHRKSILNAFEIADIENEKVYFIDETCAGSHFNLVDLAYGIYRRKSFQSSTKITMFINFGFTNVSLFVAEFQETHSKILYRKSSKGFACRNFNFSLFEFYRIRIKDQFSFDVYKSRHTKKIRQTLLNALNDQRVRLSANQESTLSIEIQGTEYELHYNLKRSEFEQIISKELKAFELFLEEANIFCSKNSIEDFDIEVIGSGSRTPCVNDLISRKFPNAKVMKTLHAKECIAVGCAIHGALQAKYKLFPFAVSQIFRGSLYLDVELSSPRKDTTIKCVHDSQRIFHNGEEKTNSKILFLREDWVHYDNLLLHLYSENSSNLKETLNLYKSKLPENKYDKIKKIKFFISLNKFGILEVKGFSETEDDELKPLFINEGNFSNLSEYEISKLQIVEEELQEKDHDFKAVKDLRNEIESLSFNISENFELNQKQMKFLENFAKCYNELLPIKEQLADLREKQIELMNFKDSLEKKSQYEIPQNSNADKVYFHPVDKLDGHYKFLYYKYLELAEMTDNPELRTLCEEYKHQISQHEDGILEKEFVIKLAADFEKNCENILDDNEIN